MPDTAYLAILDRSQATAHAAKHYPAQLELLRQITNYGTNLILRAYDSSEKDIAAAVTCTVLLRQVVSTFDAIQVLAEAGATHAAYLPARAAFEASVYLDWILFSDSDRKARCYLVGNYREERLWAKKAIAGTDEKNLLDQIATSSGLDVLPSRAAQETDAKAHLAEVDRILAQAALAAIDKEFETLKGKRKYDPEWYVTAIRSIPDRCSLSVKRR